MKRVIIGAMLVSALGGCESQLQVVEDHGAGGTTASSGGTGAASGGATASNAGSTASSGAASGGATASNAGPTASSGAANGGATHGPCPSASEEFEMLDAFDTSLHFAPTEGQDPSCPAEPLDRETCSTPEMECEYLGTNRYRSPASVTCTCLANGGPGVWKCGETNFWNVCPEELPKAGDSCVDWFGADCTRDEIRCWCEMTGDDAAEWECGTQVERRAAMEAIDPRTPVNQLSAEQRDTWCDWYASTGRASGSLHPVSDTGCVLNVGANFGHEPFNDVCMPKLAPSQCEGNLEVSDCSAPISALTDCIDSVWTELPSPNGCVPYLDTPNCSGTIVVDGDLVHDTSGSLCAVVVE